MARIPEAELERLKREVSLVGLVEGFGVELKPHGAELVGLCPFHDDHEPSLVVNPKNNLWHCLGACRIGGSVIDWVMRAEGVSFRHAVELLREGGPAGERKIAARAVKRSITAKMEPVVEADAEDREVMRQVVDYYHATLKQSAEAKVYLERRGLGSQEMIERFKLGYANRTLSYRLPARTRQAGRRLRARLVNERAAGRGRPEGRRYDEGFGGRFGHFGG